MGLHPDKTPSRPGMESRNLHLRRSLLPAVLFAFSIPLFSQNLPDFLEGAVTDSASGKPLPLVHLILRSSGTGTVTDLDGHYRLKVAVLPDTMIVSCIGFETRKIELSPDIQHELDIALSPRMVTLRPVIIIAGKAVPVFKDDRYSVLDYQFYDDHLLLLIYRNNLARSELLLLSPDGEDTLARMASLPHSPVALYKDCLDCLHLITGDAVWQVFYEGDSLALRYKSTPQKFNETFADCITNADERLFFKKDLGNGLAIEYYGVDKVTRARKTLAIVADDFKMNMLRRNPEDRMMLAMSAHDPALMGDLPAALDNRDDLSDLRRMFDEGRFVRLAVYTPVTAPLKRMDNTLIIFDFPGSKLCFFAPSGEEYGEVSITFHHIVREHGPLERLFQSKDWRDYEVYVDEQAYKAYFLKTKGASYELNEINLYTGAAGPSYRLDYPFPEKITVRDGYAYFLFKSNGDWGRKRLYRQKLD